MCPYFSTSKSIKPGQKWRIEIGAALEQCQAILVFWCEHAAQSSEVRSEYNRAILQGKRVVPVLIDHTALPPDLRQYQGVDLRMILSERRRNGVLRYVNFRAFGKDRHDRMIRALGTFGAIADYEYWEVLREAAQQLKSSLTAKFGEYTL
jgi:hypothetical protein